jgi:rhodanese-related sulfurtransferase
MKKWLFCLVCCLSMMSLQAMTLEVVENKIFATGPVGGNDFNQFKDAFENPRINTVVFVNSPGGDLWTGLTVGRMIADKGYQTVTVGSCISACSIMFMGGRDRRFGDSFRPTFNMIGIHGAHDANTKQVIGALQPQIYGFYKHMIGEKFNAPIINQALYDMQDSGGLLRIFETTRSPSAMPYHCASFQTLRRLCSEHKSEDGVTLGVLTSHELVKIELPAAFKTPPMVLGKLLDRAFDSIEAHLQILAERQCVTAVCKDAVLKWSALKENRAIASRVSGAGIGWSSDSPTAIASMVRAVYACNHARGLPVSLCQAESVNSFDVRELYAESEREHKEAIQKLKVPVDKFYGNEEFGGSFTVADGLRVQRLNDMTPQTLEGISTVGTQALAEALLSDKPPVIVDVWGAVNDVLPTAKALVNGGMAFESTTGEDFYNKRFVSLLALLVPDKTRPIVFYCASRECWQSVNAALRAKAAGYTQVQWYRGGHSSWKAAGLPTALISVQAVVN